MFCDRNTLTYSHYFYMQEQVGHSTAGTSLQLQQRWYMVSGVCILFPHSLIRVGLFVQAAAAPSKTQKDGAVLSDVSGKVL